MDSNLAISVREVTKVYRLYERPIDRLKESLSLMQVLCAVLILLAVVGTNYFGRRN